MHLYEHDQGHADMNSNLFINLPLAADLASWVTDPAALARVANGRSAQDIFTWSDSALYRSRRPELFTDSLADSSIEIDGKNPTWNILKTRDTVQKDEIVGEIKGKIGLLRDYCLDPSNRWQELRHPEPFVFFHPQLPIYIDSRQEGSLLRYVRRSCRPNVTMKTYITNEVEYHFCFVAKDDIQANSEITAMWYLDPQLFESTNGLVKQESSDSVQEVAAICISNVLAHFGGCACVPPPNCLLSSVDRRRHPKTIDSKQPNGRRKKKKPNISPIGIHNRAGSEHAQNAEDDDPAESRSASGSARGQARSRDLTPTQTPQDGHPFGESELSAREKRKIAAAEKKFQQLEQDQQTSQRKKKRTSGHSAQTTPTVGSSGQGYFGNAGASGKPYSDKYSRSPPAMSPGSWPAGRKGSPRKVSGHSTPAVRSPLGRPQYVNMGMQTEPESIDEPPEPSRHASGFTPLTLRLLKRFQSDRIRSEGGDQSLDGTASASRPSTAPQRSSPSIGEDVEMKDANSPTGIAPNQHLQSEESAKPPFRPPWPSTAAHNSRIPGISTGTSADPSPRPVSNPTFTGTFPGPTVPSIPPPSSLDPPPVTIPPSSVTAPSPVKKKLSLGDYLSRRATKTSPASEKSPNQGQGILPQKSPPAPPTDSEGPPAVDTGTQVKSPAVAVSPKAEPGPPNAMKDVSEPNPPSLPL